MFIAALMYIFQSTQTREWAYLLFVFKILIKLEEKTTAKKQFLLGAFSFTLTLVYLTGRGSDVMCCSAV